MNLYPRPQQGGYPYQEPYSPRAYQPYPSYAGEPGLPSGLLGPGVPGGASRPPSGRSESLSPVLSPVSTTSHPVRTRDFLRHPPSPPRMYAPEHPRPASSGPASSLTFRDISRTLPPLIFPQPSRQVGSATIPSIRSAPANIPPPFPFQQSRSPELAFSPQLTSTEPRSSSLSALPPPFTLEPQPQWNDPVFTSVPRTASSTWSHPGSDRGGSSSPTVSRIPHHPRGLSEPSQAISSREGWYDPVRSVVVPYHSPKSPSLSDHEKE